MNISTLLENQLLATKFYVPIASSSLIARPRLHTLLNQSLTHPLTLLSAPAGFGKTTLLATWTQSLPANNPFIAWISLDEEDNDPRMFWTYILTSLKRQQPQRFTPLLTQLQSPQVPPLKHLLTALINLLLERTDHFLLILDDYQVITDLQVHSTLSYLIEHLPAQLRIILSTRTDPPLPLLQLRVYRQVLEVRTDQLRCTIEETTTFFKEKMDIQLPNETIQEIRSRTEGWLVGLQLLTLSLPEQTDPITLLKEVSGDQRYILDYLTEEVLRHQPQDVQTFLLSTSILDRLTAPLCDTILEQTGSQQMLQQLERTNLFVASLDSKRQWYRYHALFAEVLRHHLEQIHGDLVPILHHRASLWYIQHNQTTQAILHAFSAKEWHFAADLIEGLPLWTFLTGAANQHELTLLRQWLEHLPTDIVHSRPRLCLICAEMLWRTIPEMTLVAWLDAAETALTTSLAKHSSEQASSMVLTQKQQQEQQDLLGEVFAFRAFIQSPREDGQATLAICQRALTLLSAENIRARIQVAWSQLTAYYYMANNAVASIESGKQAASLARSDKQPVLAISYIGSTALNMIGAGQLHAAEQLCQQATQIGAQSGEFLLPIVGYPMALQAEILRERNQLDTALSLVQEAITLCKQIGSPTHLFFGHVVQMRIYFSKREVRAAYDNFLQIERLCEEVNQPTAIHLRSHFTTIDQVRLWLACGELERAIRWAQEIDIAEKHNNPFVHEREEVACIRVLLANKQPHPALQRLEPVLQRATMGQRWRHTIEIYLLQALTHQMCHQDTQALEALSKAVHLAEPEGYIRSFLDEGASMEALFYQLQKREHIHIPTPYLDTVIAAFQQENASHIQTAELTKPQAIPDPLSEREREVLQLLAHGTSNQEIAQELVITIDTVKRHVSHIFSKLGVRNRVQAVKQAQKLGLLDEDD